MQDEATTGVIAGAIYVVARAIEAGFKKLVALMRRAEDNRVKDREDARLQALLEEIKREQQETRKELKAEIAEQRKEHSDTRTQLARLEATQKEQHGSVLRRIDDVLRARAAD